MKTAISIPDTTFQSAEKLAKRLGKSRSQLYTQALNKYLEQHDGKNTEKLLNRVYATEDSRLPASLKRLQSKSIAQAKW